LAASATVAMKIGPMRPPLPIGQPLPARFERLPAFDKRPDAIVRRNIFCSRCPPLSFEIADADAKRAAVTERRTALPIALLAVMYVPPSRIGNLSIAVVKDTESRLIGAFVLGDRIRGAAIRDIRETRVYVDHAGSVEYLDLLETPPVTNGPAAGKGKDSIAADLDRGITRLGEHRYEIQRHTLESLLGNVGLLSRSARPVPEIKEGRMIGFRLFGVRPDGPVGRIGMKNADVITSVNGLELSSPEQAIEAFGKLRSASHLSLRFERDGVKTTNDCSIR